MSSPFQRKFPDDFKSQMIEHLISGIVYVQNEVHSSDPNSKTYSEDDPSNDTYQMRCGLPDNLIGQLVNIARIYGTLNDSFYEFVLNTDYTYDNFTNNLLFINPPDSLSSFKVSYRYDQKYKSKLTNIDQGTTIDMLMSAISQQMGTISSDILLSKYAGFSDFAEGDDLDQLYALLNIERNPATGATGFVTATRSGSSGNLTIIIGATFSTTATSLVSAIIFEVTQSTIIPDGFSQARIPIKAISGFEGANSNIAPNRIVNIIDASGVTIVNNPFKYIDYEFIPVIEGKYVYFLQFPPERTINSQAYPPASTDKGLYTIIYWSDKTINGSNWVVGSGTMTIVEDSPINGTTKINVTVAGYIRITGLNIPTGDGRIYHQGYDQVYIYIRGPAGETFGITMVDGVVSNSIVSLYKFNDTPATTKVVENDFKLFHGNHGLTDEVISSTERDDGVATVSTGIFTSALGAFESDGVMPGDMLVIDAGENDEGNYKVIALDVTTPEIKMTVSPDFLIGGVNQTYNIYRQNPIIEIRIDLNTVGDYYIDFIGVGTFLNEVSSVDLDTPDEITISYTSSRISVHQDVISNDFFDTYDGDASDGHSDELFIFYEWKNNIAGGSDEESDVNFRLRGKIASASFGKGTKNAIRSALLDIDSIKEAIVQDFDDDPSISPGDIYVFIYAEGFKLSSSLQAQIVQSVDENRAAGIRASIFLPEVRYVNFIINIVYDDTTGDYVGAAGLLALKNIISSVIDDYFLDQIGINDSLYFSDLIGYAIDLINVVIGGYITYDNNLINETDASTTVDTGIFTTATGGLIVADVTTDDFLIIETGNDAGTYIVITRIDDNELLVTPNFPLGDTGKTFKIVRTPSSVDDDIDSTYIYDPTIILENPLRISGIKTGVSIIIQRGNFSLTNILLIGKTSQ